MYARVRLRHIPDDTNLFNPLHLSLGREHGLVGVGLPPSHLLPQGILIVHLGILPASGMVLDVHRSSQHLPAARVAHKLLEHHVHVQKKEERCLEHVCRKIYPCIAALPVLLLLPWALAQLTVLDDAFHHALQVLASSDGVQPYYRGVNHLQDAVVVRAKYHVE